LVKAGFLLGRTFSRALQGVRGRYGIILLVGASSMDRSSNIACVIGITISSDDRDSSLILRATQVGTCLGLDRTWCRDFSVALLTSTSALGFRQVRWKLLALCDDPKRDDPRHNALQ